LSESADVLYKTTEYCPASTSAPSFGVIDDRDPVAAGGAPIVSDKDAAAPLVGRADLFD